MMLTKHLRTSYVSLCAAFACVLLAASLQAQDPGVIFNRALTESGCKRMLDACQAASLDPKKKDYREECDRDKTAISRSDEAMKNKALDAINTKDLATAKRITNLMVCSADIKQTLQSQIADATPKDQPPPPPQPKADQSSTFLAEANSAFNSGKFDAAVSSAQQVTDPNLKPLAQDIINKVNAYHTDVAAARAAEGSKDYAGAISNWQKAQGISSNGPDSPASNIARLEPLAHPPTVPVAGNPTVPPHGDPLPPKNDPKKQPPQPQPTNPKPDPGAQVATLMDQATKAEASNNMQAAVRAYDAILRLQPDNPIATTKKAALLVRINSDPAEQAKSLTTAIRDFYSSRYTDAEDSLQAYLDAPTAKSKGAAHFYLGATRLYEKILSTSGQKVDSALASTEVQRQFKEARASGYRPLEKFVSPVIMRAWQSAQ
jgi:tetratricopeptide (TPR) repeat protein